MKFGLSVVFGRNEQRRNYSAVRWREMVMLPLNSLIVSVPLWLPCLWHNWSSVAHFCSMTWSGIWGANAGGKHGHCSSAWIQYDLMLEQCRTASRSRAAKPEITWQFHVSLVRLERRNSLKWSSALLMVLRIERNNLLGFIGFQKIQGCTTVGFRVRLKGEGAQT